MEQLKKSHQNSRYSARFSVCSRPCCDDNYNIIVFDCRVIIVIMVAQRHSNYQAAVSKKTSHFCPPTCKLYTRVLLCQIKHKNRAPCFHFLKLRVKNSSSVRATF